MSWTEYRIVTIESPEHGHRFCLATFDTRDWGSAAEQSAREFAKHTQEAQPGIRLEIEVVFLKSETTRIIRL